MDTLDSAEHMKAAAFRELEEALRIKRIHEELLEHLASALRWILHYCKKNNFEIPEREKIMQLVDTAIAIEDKLPTELQEWNRTTHSSTERQSCDDTKKSNDS